MLLAFFNCYFNSFISDKRNSSLSCASFLSEPNLWFSDSRNVCFSVNRSVWRWISIHFERISASALYLNSKSLFFACDLWSRRIDIVTELSCLILLIFSSNLFPFSFNWFCRLLSSFLNLVFSFFNMVFSSFWFSILILIPEFLSAILSSSPSFRVWNGRKEAKCFLSLKAWNLNLSRWSFFSDYLCILGSTFWTFLMEFFWNFEKQTLAKWPNLLHRLHCADWAGHVWAWEWWKVALSQNWHFQLFWSLAILGWL